MAACSEAPSRPIMTAQVSPHFLVTRVGIGLPTGQLLLDADTADRLSGTFDNGDSTLDVAVTTSGHATRVELSFDRVRQATFEVDYEQGRVRMVNEQALVPADIMNIARLLQIMERSPQAEEVGSPRHTLIGALRLYGMRAPGTTLGIVDREMPSLALVQPGEAKLRRIAVASSPPAGETLSPEATMAAAGGNPFFLVLPAEPPVCTPDNPDNCTPGGGGGGGTQSAPAWLERPTFSGATAYNGDNGVKCVTPGYYYKIRWDYRRRLFGPRRFVNTWAPVMPPSYTVEQARARDGMTCHGLVGPNCTWGTTHGWTLDAARHDDCSKRYASFSLKCVDEFAQCIDDALAGAVCSQTAATYTNDRIAFTSWAPHYENQPVGCNNGLIDPGETHDNCPQDVPAPVENSSTCGDGICGADEASCTADCGPPNCGDAQCKTGEGENGATCPADCGNTYCGNGTCEAAIESVTTCPEDCRPILVIE